MIKVRLLECVHEVWCPAGTVGNMWYEDEWYEKFLPDNPPPGFPWKDGIYISGKKYEKLDGNGQDKVASPLKSRSKNSP